ncbi:two-component system NtrC family sensor kinase [Desulfobaculum xiamenense]|uniref:histidine kinase n=1 Tax=Desulfobaculum xiamenense TaxID=995050 RepID=A0A846QNS3_9BACT|nr:sensor histidine kinase [Desulfobaculum xiamenense]NJB68837.1 two-component system NtrC family sensor kinase [Desulfobaculum xiamenense]
MNPEELHSPRYYRTLTRSMAAIVILVSMTPLLLISAVSSYQFHYSFQSKVEAQLKEMVQKHQQTIDLYLSEKLGELRLVARTKSFAELSDNAQLAAELRHLQEEFSGAFVDLGLVADNGVQSAYAGPFPLRNADYSGSAWFRRAMESEFYISDVFLGLRGVPHFIVAVRQKWEGRQWILRATIDFMAFNSLVENIRIGRTGSAFIINNQGTFQTGPPRDASLDTRWLVQALQAQGRGSKVPSGTPEGTRTPLRSYWSSAIMPGKVTVFRHADPEGVDAIYVSTRLKGGDWILIYRQDEADAFSALYQTRRLVVFIVGAGGVAIILMAVLLSRRIVRHIEQADHEKEVMNDQVIEAGKLASIGELAAGIAHEINNPVAIMVEEAGWIGDLMREGEDPRDNRGEIAKSLQQIRTQGARCKEITHKLLSFARKIDPTMREVDLNDLVREVASLSEQRARYGNIEVELDLGEGLPSLEGSPSELQQVLLNLVNNAIDAMGTRGGKVRVRTAYENEGIRLSVEDNGEGIPKANISRIFDPFFTTKPVGKGTGLGLSIIYGIVKKMGGEISVESEQNVGTTFHVRFPVPGRKGESDASEA